MGKVIAASIFALAVFLTTTLAAPTNAKPSKPRLVAPLKRVNDGKLHRRYNGNEQVTGVPNGGQMNWAVSVQIGGYEGNLLIDTGSADLWVLGPQAPNPNGQPVYYPGEKNANPGEAFNIRYLGPNNWVSGDAALDSVTVAGYQVPRMALGVANAMGSDHIGHHNGIIGFGFQGQNSISPDKSKTFMEMAQPNLDQPIFALALHADGSGSIELGAVDDAAHKGDLMNLPVDGSTGSWIVQVSFDFGNGFNQQMSFDTGAGYTTVDTSIASAYWGQVDGASDTVGDGSGWQFPCDADLPFFNLYVNGNRISLGKGVLNWGPSGNGENMCSAGLQGRAGTGSMGIPLFEKYYVVFNQKDPSIQLALQAYLFESDSTQA